MEVKPWYNKLTRDWMVVDENWQPVTEAHFLTAQDAYDWLSGDDREEEF